MTTASPVAWSVPVSQSSDIAHSNPRLLFEVSLGDVVQALMSAVDAAMMTGSMAEVAELKAMAARVEEILEERE